MVGNVSIPVRGPVSIQEARSLEVVDIIDIGITKITNLDNTKGNKKDNTTMSNKYIISHGAYVAYGSIFPQLAELTGFSQDDVTLLKSCLATIFENDASAARPSGSMGSQLFWWEHDCPTGKKNSLYVHRSLNIKPDPSYPYFTCDPEDIPGIKFSAVL